MDNKDRISALAKAIIGSNNIGLIDRVKNYRKGGDVAGSAVGGGGRGTGGNMRPQVDFDGIKTTNNRPYNTEYVSYIDSSLADAGIPPMRRASILANIIEESGGNPFAEGPGGYYGLLQWSGERYPRTKETDVYKEIDNQVKNILDTEQNATDRMSWTHGGPGSGYNSLKDAMAAYNGDVLEDVMRGYTLGYVRPAGGIDSYNNRLKVAQQLYNLEGFQDYKSGGKIHIKPENRGKFTALKKRTGHSASWFKAHGTPAQRKMATFELNAKKWKHENGGLLHRYDGESEPTGQMNVSATDYNLEPAVVKAYEPLYVEKPYTYDDFFTRWYPNRKNQLAFNMAVTRANRTGWPFGQQKKAQRNVDGYIESMLENNKNVKEFGVPLWGRYSDAIFPNAFNDADARKVLSDHLESKFKWLGKDVPEEGFSDNDIAWYEMGTSYGKSYNDNPYYIFYDRARPDAGTIVHERTHVLKPLPKDAEPGGQYNKYRWFGSPMVHMADKIKDSLVDYNAFRPIIGKPVSYPERLYSDTGLNELKKEDSNIGYYSDPEEIVARLNEIRFRMGLNPKHEITAEDLKEIRKKATKEEKSGFLDLYTDEALLKFFNMIASNSLVKQDMSNMAASGGFLNRVYAKGGLLERAGSKEKLLELVKKIKQTKQS